MTSPRELVAENLKPLRQSAGLSEEGLAEKAGCELEVSRIERAESHLFLEDIFALALALGAEPAALLRLPNEKARSDMAHWFEVEPDNLVHIPSEQRPPFKSDKEIKYPHVIVAENLKLLRQSAGVSLDELFERVDLCFPQVLNSFEKADEEFPIRVETLCGCAIALGVDPEDMVRLPNKESKFALALALGVDPAALLPPE